MAINISPVTFGYVLIALGVITGAALLWALSSKANLGGYRIKLQHVAFPIIAIGAGVSFIMGNS